MSDICTDNRFELIEKYKKKLIESTNIESSQDEMAVLDDLLFRFWQMGWLDRLEQPDTDEWCHDCKEYDKEHHCCPRWNRVIRTTLEEAQPDKDYEKGWEEGREALRKEIWENERDRLDQQTGGD